MPPDISNVARTHCENYVKEYATLTNLNPDEPTVPIRQAISLSTADSVAIVQHEEEQRAKKQPGTEEDPPKPLPILAQPELLQKISAGDPDFRRVFVAGGGGTGKSETTRLIAHHLATAFLNGTSKLLPLRVELKGATEKLTGGWKELLELLAPNEHQWLVSDDHRKNICFIIDGLDECRFTRDQFATALKSLIAKFNDCSFIVAGRLGSLPDGLLGFATHVIQPLTYGQIGAFARAYFAAPPGRSKQMAKDLASSFIAALRAAQHALDPLIFTPFMVHFALRLHSKGLPIPANPALLIELGLLKLWDDRRDRKSIATPTNDGKGTLTLPESDEILDALSTIAAHTLLREPRNTEDVPNLNFSPDDAKQWLRDHSELCKSVSLTELFHRLVPHCGVLFRAGDDYVFNNKVLAEFLSARWIARHAYPNWPYKERSRAYVDPDRVKDERERSFLDLFGDFAFSDTWEPLIQAVRWQLGRMEGPNAASNAQLLIRTAEWFHDSALAVSGRNTPIRDSLDAAFTLLARIFGCLSALPDQSAHKQDVLEQVSIIATPDDTRWIYDTIARRGVPQLPVSLRDPFLNALTDALQKAAENPVKNGAAISSLARAIAQGWAGNKDAMAKALNALTDALQKAAEKPMENQTDIGFLAGDIAQGWAGNKDALYALTDVLQKAAKKPVKNGFAISVLAGDIAHGWAGNKDALHALTDALQKAAKKPVKNELAISVLAGPIAKGWAGNKDALNALADALQKVPKNPVEKRSAFSYLARPIAEGWVGNKDALNALTEALQKVAEKPVENGVAISHLAGYVAQGWAGNKDAMAKALNALTDAVQEAAKEPVENGVAISSLARAIAQGWAGNKDAMAKALNALTDALQEAAKEPVENGVAISSLARAIAQGWAGNKDAMAKALNALTDALQEAAKEPVENGVAISSLARAIAQGWVGNKDALNALTDALQKAAEKPLECDSAIRDLAEAIAQGWADNAKALNALTDALQKAAEKPLECDSAIRDLAEAIAQGWADNAKALNALTDVLQKAAKKPVNDGLAIRDLAGAIAQGWAGNVVAAVGINRVGLGYLLDSDRWRPWVCLIGPKSKLRSLLESWGVIQLGQDLPPDIALPRDAFINPDNPDPQYCLVYPREAIRRGLPASILHDIIDASRPVTPINPDSLIGPVADALEIQMRKKIDQYMASTLIHEVLVTIEPRPHVPPSGELDEIANNIALLLVRDPRRFREFEQAVVEWKRRIEFCDKQVKLLKAGTINEYEQGSINTDLEIVLRKLSTLRAGTGLQASKLLPDEDNAGTRVRDAVDPNRIHSPFEKQLRSLVVTPKTNRRIGYRLATNAWDPPHPDAPHPQESEPRD